MQAAADAAVLAAGASEKEATAELKAIAQNFLDANGLEGAIDALEVTDIQHNAGTGAISVDLQGKLKTSFMSLAGIDTMDITAHSEAMKAAAGPLEMVLALDTTYSMSPNSKMDTLKTAAKALVNNVMKGGSVKVGIAPFSSYFKVGTSYAGEPWVNAPADSSSTWESCNYSYPNKSGCTTTPITTCYSDGVPYSCGGGETCTNWGDPEITGCHWVTSTDTWDGCVAARPPAYHNSIGDIDVPYPGVLWDCGAAMVDLTTNKGNVISAIEGLWPSGETNLPSGLIWAWNMITPDAPLTNAMPDAELAAKGGKRAIVLMTDGTNTVSPYDDGNYGSHTDTGYGDSTYTDNLTSTLCENIKAQGTVVYTVLFDVVDANIENLLRNCATDSTKSFVAGDNAALVAAFKKIGNSLTQLRLSK